MSVREHENTGILLVEDHPGDAQLALRAFKKSRVAAQITVAHDGVEALDYLFARGAYAERDARDLPRVMLLDLKLPRLDGLEVMQQVRADQRTRFLPIVVMTSSVEQEDLVESYRLGANSYVRKPVDFAQFADAVKQLGIYWLDLNQVPRS
jgi:two-component system response regulator